jgi:6-phosphogluconate dehydrogenase
MGRNLALNMADHGISVVGYDPAPANECLPKGILVTSSADLVKALNSPRVILLMVPAGESVDQQIQLLSPHLQPGDMMVDCGNSHFRDTRRRAQTLTENGIDFIGLGVSGGAEGARFGPSMMGDSLPTNLAEILAPIAAKEKNEPCLASFGGPGSGHFVKMIHNGIEYADMQMIAEAVYVLRYGAGMSVAAIGELFGRWNQGALGSYLLEITSKILLIDEGGTPYVDLIVDEAGQKGTGYWAVEAAMSLGVAAPSLAAAVDARTLSSMGQLRATLKCQVPYPMSQAVDPVHVHDALLAGKICAYAQGFSILSAAKGAFWPDLDLAEAARVWRQGCIIRSTLLERIRGVLLGSPGLSSLLLDQNIRGHLAQALGGLRNVVVSAQAGALPVPAFASALGYLDGLAGSRLWADIVQAQRDFFGQHGFKRIDKPGGQHGPWGVTS